MCHPIFSFPLNTVRDLRTTCVPESFEDELDDKDGGAAHGHALVQLDDVVEAEEDLQFDR